MYYIKVAKNIWYKSHGETNENEETQVSMCFSQDQAHGFETRQEADEVNDRFQLGGEITEIV